jgi:hypothetical protein
MGSEGIVIATSLKLIPMDKGVNKAINKIAAFIFLTTNRSPNNTTGSKA